MDRYAFHGIFGQENHIEQDIMKIKEYFSIIKTDRTKRNRFILLIFSLMITGDYLMFCFHAGKNPLAVFPPFPVHDSRPYVKMFLPDLDGDTILEEERRLFLSGTEEQNVKAILTAIARGSLYENTKPAVPVRLLPRKIWITKGECIIDLAYIVYDEKYTFIPGSEKLFQEAVLKSITANIPGIQKVTFVNNGIYGKPLWEF